MKHYDFTPYNYAIDNPSRYIDPDGKQVDPNEQRANHYLNEDLGFYEKAVGVFENQLNKAVETAILITLGQGIDFGLQQGAKSLGIKPGTVSVVYSILTNIAETNPVPEYEQKVKLELQIAEIYEKRTKKEVKEMNERRKNNTGNSQRAKSPKTYYEGRKRNIPE